MPAIADHSIVAFGSEASGPIITIAAPTMLLDSWGVGVRS
jgi:hypothetical protein